MYFWNSHLTYMYCVAWKYYVSTRVLVHTIICLGKQNWWCIIIHENSKMIWRFKRIFTPHRFRNNFYLHLYAYYFSSELIWNDWSTPKVANFWFSKSFFYVKNLAKFVFWFFSLKNNMFLWTKHEQENCWNFYCPFLFLVSWAYVLTALFSI